MESPLVCDILSYADPETGLMPEGFMDSIGTFTFYKFKVQLANGCRIYVDIMTGKNCRHFRLLTCSTSIESVEGFLYFSQLKVPHY